MSANNINSFDMSLCIIHVFNYFIKNRKCLPEDVSVRKTLSTKVKEICLKEVLVYFYYI